MPKIDAKNFRPIWRLSISANEDGEALAALPPPNESFEDKVIYLKCYPPLQPYSDGTDDGRKAFWERLVGAIPAFLYEIENLPIPEQFRKARFGIKEFHHPEVLELIAAASPVAPLGELIYKWLGDIGGEIEAPSVELFEKLREWNQGTLANYSKSAGHFGWQLYRLRRLPGWKDRISSNDQRIGPNKRRQTLWKITQ